MSEGLVTSIDIPEDIQGNIHDVELIPEGTPVVVEVTELPKLAESKSTPGGKSVSIAMAIVSPEQYVPMPWLYYSIVIPSVVYKAKCAARMELGKDADPADIEIRTAELAQNQPKDIPDSAGFGGICARYNAFLKLINQGKATLELEPLIGMIFRCVVGKDEWQGVWRNKVRSLAAAPVEVNSALGD